MVSKKVSLPDEQKKTVTEEKKQQYRENKKKKEKSEREARKQERLENRTADRRLAFLINIFDSLGYSTKQVAEKAGYSQQLLSWYFAVKDDCRLSVAQKMLESLGYDLSVAFRKENQVIKKIDLGDKKEGNNNGVKFVIEGDLEEEIKWRDPYIPPYILDCDASFRMNFIANYFYTLKINVLDFCQKCALDPTSLRYIFMKDDCRISQIFNIAKGTGGEIVWKISKKK